jgi:hypothetical protein
VPVLNVLDRTVDTRIEWTPGIVGEVEVARAAFVAAKEKGFLTYKCDADGNKGEVIQEFDPNASQIIASPPTVGG